MLQESQHWSSRDRATTHYRAPKPCKHLHNLVLLRSCRLMVAPHVLLDLLLVLLFQRPLFFGRELGFLLWERRQPASAAAPSTAHCRWDAPRRLTGTYSGSLGRRGTSVLFESLERVDML